MNTMKADWRQKLKAEFDLAVSARAQGNEGRARVCARRAAGVAIREYLTRRGIYVSSTSAYDLLNRLTESPEITPDLKQICIHLTIRVTDEFKLPIDVDLVDESRQLCHVLLPDWNPSSR
jgi:hypothetical protein